MGASRFGGKKYRRAFSQPFISPDYGGNNLPPGGTAGQALTKIDAVDYNAHWTTISSGSGSELKSILAAAFTNGDVALTSTPIDIGIGVTPIANKNYWFEALVVFNRTGGSGTPAIDLIWPTGITAQEVSDTTTSDALSYGTQAATVTFTGLSSATMVAFRIKGIINAGATPSGALKFQAKASSGAPLISVAPLSYIRLTEYS